MQRKPRDVASQCSVAGSQTVIRRIQAHSEVLAGYSHKSNPMTNRISTELLFATKRRHQYGYKLLLLDFVHHVTDINTETCFRRRFSCRRQARSAYYVTAPVSVVPSD
jgi:hypothetical protein